MPCEGPRLLAADARAAAAAIEREKRALRTAMAELRASCPAAARETAARAVAGHVLALPEYAAAHAVGLHAALADEVPLDAVAEAVLAAGRVLALPRMQGDRLHFARVERWAALVRGRFGIPEPPGTAPEVAFARGDLLLLPGVAFDAGGGRLGRGGGHYDRALAGLRETPYLVGVGFAFQLVARVPMAAHDRRVDAFVSERGTTRRALRDRSVDPS